MCTTQGKDTQNCLNSWEQEWFKTDFKDWAELFELCICIDRLLGTFMNEKKYGNGGHSGKNEVFLCISY